MKAQAGRETKKKRARIVAQRFADVYITQTKGDRESGASFLMATREMGTGSKTLLVATVPQDNGKVLSVKLNGHQARGLLRVMQKHHLRGDRALQPESHGARQEPEVTGERVIAAYKEGLTNGMLLGQADLLQLLGRFMDVDPVALRAVLAQFMAAEKRGR